MLKDLLAAQQIGMYKTDKRKLGWRVESNFEMTLHKKDTELLVQFKKFLGNIGLLRTTYILVIIEI